MEMQVLENNFEQIYREWFIYNEFFNKLEKNPEKRKEKLTELANKGVSEEELVNEIFDSGIGYEFHKKDLDILSQRLLSAYKTVEGYLDVPQEALDNIKQLQLSPTLYVIEKGVAKAMDEDLLEKVKLSIRKDFEVLYNELKKQSSN